MTITDNINDLYSAMLLLEQLDNPEYLEANGISPDEVEDFKKHTAEQILGFEKQAKEYIEYLLQKRQELMISIVGIEAEEKRLAELKASYQKKLDSGVKWIDYLLKTFKIDKMDTAINKLSYRKSEAVMITDEEAIPNTYKKEKTTISIDRVEIKKILKEGIAVPGASIEVRQNLQIK